MPDALREREPLTKGAPPTSEKSKILLAGKTLFITGDKNTGALYTLAKHHGKKAHTKKTEINGEVGTLVWFESEEG